jgi:hypothetical protein
VKRIELLAGIFFALITFVMQGKGYPYQRYPLLILLILVINQDIFEAANKKGMVRWVAYAGIVFQCLVLAPVAAWRVHTFRSITPFNSALSSAFGRYGADVDGRVQCLDTFGGCVNTLYNQRLMQSTGYLYDCYLFAPEQNEVTRRYRDDFWRSFQNARPKLVVMTDQFCFGDGEGFGKIDRWPAMKKEIDGEYSLDMEWHPMEKQRWWGRSELPASFRIYLRKPGS